MHNSLRIQICLAVTTLADDSHSSTSACQGVLIQSNPVNRLTEIVQNGGKIGPTVMNRYPDALNVSEPIVIVLSLTIPFGHTRVPSPSNPGDGIDSITTDPTKPSTAVL